MGNEQAEAAGTRSTGNSGDRRLTMATDIYQLCDIIRQYQLQPQRDTRLTTGRPRRPAPEVQATMAIGG